jgi:murein DD-endopeptidase MepM/ murein hydrolase activator NlpD
VTANNNVDVAAKQLEAFFLRRLLAEAKPKGGLLDGGFAGETFNQMLDEALADKISGAGGLGMAAQFATQLGPQPTETSAPIPAVAFGPELDGMRLAQPVIGRASSGYGERVHPVNGSKSMHAGLDLAAPMGAAVTAAAEGTVTHAGPAGTYGNLVTIRHANGYETRYAHLSAVSIEKGATVAPGQELGKVGSTGLSTGPHLHFELRHGGKAMDPAPLMPGINSSGRRPSR